MTDIHEKIKRLSDEFLLEQFFTKRHEYTPEAIALLEKEITVRNLKEKYKEFFSGDTPSSDERQEYLDDEFIPFDHGFNQANVLLARSILTEEKIPFFITSSSLSAALPLESETGKLYRLHVPKSLLEKARERIDSHFHSTNGQYSVKYSNTKERLRSFSAHETSPLGDESEEEINVQFTKDESAAIAKYIGRLLAEANTIEETGRIIFYFDNLQECLNHINEKNRSHFSKTDLFTIIEVLQIYCDSEGFPLTLENTAEALINFFSA